MEKKEMELFGRYFCQTCLNKVDDALSYVNPTNTLICWRTETELVEQ